MGERMSSKGSEGLADPSKTAQLVNGNKWDLNTDLLHSVGKNLKKNFFF